MINDYIATLTVDQLHEYVTTMATKITKQQMSSVVSIGTIVSKNGTNYLVQLNTSATPVTARLLKSNEVYNINDEVYLTQLSGTAGGETQLIYYIYGRVQETNNLLNNITNETAFKPIISSQDPDDVTLENYKKYPTVKIDCECSCDFRGKTFKDFGIRVYYKLGGTTVEIQEFNTSHMQGQPHYMMTAIPQAYIFTRQCTNFNNVEIISFGTDGTTTIDNIKLSLGYLADFDFKVNIEALGQSYWPRDILASNITLQAKATYQGDELTDDIEYYWFIKAKTSSSTPKIPEIGGNDWVCLNSYETSQVANTNEPITIWDTESNLITLNRTNNIISQNSKFVNNIKCVAVYHGINVTSNILELIDFQHEQYDVYLTSSLSEPYQLLKEDDIVDLVCHIDNDNQNSNILSTLGKTYTWYTILREATQEDTADNTLLFFTYTADWQVDNTETRRYYEVDKEQVTSLLAQGVVVFIGEQINTTSQATPSYGTLRILYQPTHHLSNAINYYMTGDGQQDFFCVVGLTLPKEDDESTEIVGTYETSDSRKVTTKFVDRLWTVYSENSSEDEIGKPYYIVQDNGIIETNININNDPNSSATWQLEVTEQSVWQCQKVDSALLGAATTWSTPILLRGRDGIIGADGATLQLLFKLQDSQPGKPTLDYEQYPTIPFDTTKHNLILNYAIVPKIDENTDFTTVEPTWSIDIDSDFLDGTNYLYYYISMFTRDPETEIGKTDIQKILLEASDQPLKVTFELTTDNTITCKVGNNEVQTVIGLDWSQTDSAFQPGDKLWMSQKLSNQDPSFWSTPIPFSGQDGATIKYMYSLREEKIDWVDKSNWNSTGVTPDISGQDYWTDDPQGVTDTAQYEYVSVRRKDAGSITWGNWSTPTLWAKWGEHGQDGSGIEYLFYLSDSDSAPDAPTYAKGNRGDQEKYDYTADWQDNPPAPTSTQPYVYVSKFKTNPDGIPILDTPEQTGQDPIATGTEPALWTRYPLNYEISLDEDFISIPTNSDKELVSDFTIPIPVLTVYQSGIPLIVDNKTLQISWKNGSKLWEINLQRESESSPWRLVPDSTSLAAGKSIPDRSVINIIYKPNDVVLAETFIEIVPQKAGSDGSDGSYVYALASANVLKFKKDETKFTPESVDITLHKRIGSGEASQVTDKDYYLTVTNGKITKYSNTTNGEVPLSSDAEPVIKEIGYQFTIEPTSTDIDQDIVIVIYEWGNYDEDDEFEIDSVVVDKITINLIEDVTSPYNINLDNEYDSIVFTNNGKLVGNDSITINAEWYQGINRISSEKLPASLYSFEAAKSEFKVQATPKPLSDTDNTMIGMTITLSELSKWTGTDATITFMHPSDQNITRTFKMKKIISNVDYDLIPSQRVINTSTNSYPTVSFSVLIKNANGSTATQTTPTFDTDNKIIDPFELQQWKKPDGSSSYTWVTLNSWTSSVTTSTNKFRLVDATNNAIIWDQEEIEFIRNGSQGTRGTSIIPITTQPTPISSGSTYSYYINSQTLASSLIVGDICEYDSYHYPVKALASPMVYFGSRTDISGSKGDTVKQVRAYYKTNNFGFSNVPSSAPSDNSTAVNTWTFNSLIEPDSATKYIYSSVGTGTISGADSTDIDYGNWTTPELWKAYVGSNIPAHAAVTFAKLFTGSNGTVEQGLKYDTNGKVYINASLIKTGLLSVGDDGELLSAGWNGTTPTVELAGWTATPQMLCYNNLQPGATDSVCLIPKGGGTLTKPIGGKAATNWVITAGSAFGVTKEGK